MNLAEQILRRKYEAMYKPHIVHSPITAIAPESPLARQQTQISQSIDANVVLTRDGRIRCVRGDTNSAASMSEINVDLDL